MDVNKFRIRFLTDNDVQETIKLFANTYCAREPVVRFLTQNIGYNFSAEKYVSKSKVHQKLSIVCEDVSKPIGEQIVGAQLYSGLKLKFNSSIDKHDVIELITHNLISEWIRLHPEFKFEELIEKVFHLGGIAIKDEYENFGIGTKLIMESLNCAKQRGFQIALLEASGYKTQKIFGEKLKFKEMNSIVYDKFEIDGRRVFKGLKSPQKIIVYEKYLDSL
ncbi:hypothetical protein B4U79_17731 [Dinothrombium tinctorium]|uniref:N-acetyltransferase domain-containing protein n=1 Tax=Dinothrombium tinctorium TaxID=1965070 RepID=A0A443R192_9ACAR|nr:hypothetical protein B4U79_17731 [Dinothrombium tinctorium]